MPRKNVPTERMCLVTRNTLPTDELLRFVLSPDGKVVPDLKNSLPGRGVWVTASATDVDFAVEKRLFARGFKTSADAAPDLAKQVDVLLENALIGALSMAQKAGQATTGFSKVMSALETQYVVLVLAAQDGAEDGQRKVRNKLFAMGLLEEIDQVGWLTSDQLSKAFGRDNVNHAALFEGGASNSAYEKANRLARYRGITLKNTSSAA